MVSKDVTDDPRITACDFLGMMNVMVNVNSDQFSESTTVKKLAGTM